MHIHRSSLIWAFLPALLINVVFLAQPWFNPRLAYVDPLIAPIVAGTCCGLYFGMVSNIGVLYWAAAASCCALAALVVPRQDGRDGVRDFLLAAALFTGLLCVDDLFLLHEELLPKLGIPQKLILIGYVVLALFYLWRQWPVIRRHEPALFLASVGFLGLSVVVDYFNHSDRQVLLLIEDAAKLMGVAGWGTYHIRFAVHSLRPQGVTEPRVEAGALPQVGGRTPPVVTP